MSAERIVVFTDGAASGNPGPGGWGAIVVTPAGRVVELGGGAPHTTNNRMELTGAIEALAYLAGDSTPVAIFTDSSYLIQGITQWVWAWQRRGWKTAAGGDVLNRELWERLSGLVRSRGTGSITWNWVRGHDGTPGNERVDQIAVAFSRGRSEALYDGPLDGYGVAIHPLPETTQAPSRSAASGGSSAKASPHSYLSFVDGVLERHTTWAECEGRVKGRAGARFKKAMSADDEAAILRGWGLKP